MNKEEFKQTFLKLVEYTIPFGYEKLLEKYLPTGYKKDSIGNYYYEIGNSETLFTTHLDTYSNKHEKVNVVINKDPYIISTDGTTILGGDNKLGSTILISMIKDNVPGTYYFFLGEEPILSGGLYGSRGILEANPNYFKKFKRCIAFDRRGYNSIVMRQMGRMCCSTEFATAISKELGDWDRSSDYGYYTDTAVFMDVIEECTNISAGGFNEHYVTEWVDLNYTYNVYKKARTIDWESLPTVRELEERFSVGGYKSFVQKKNYEEITGIFSLFGLYETRNKVSNNLTHITYSKWLDNSDFDIYLDHNRIIFDDKIVSMNRLKSIIIDFFKEDLIDEIEYYLDLLDKGVDSANKKIEDILKVFGKKDIYDFLDELI